MTKLYAIGGACVLIALILLSRKIKNKKQLKEIDELEYQLYEAQKRAEKINKQSESDITALKHKTETEVKLAQTKALEQMKLEKADNSAESYNDIVEGFNK